MKYRIGVDVGGTNTDAIIIDENNIIVSKYKTYTTSNIIDGINDAIKTVVKNSNINTNDIKQAMLGTTQCTNAIVERKKLSKVITIRLAGPATQSVAPFCDWPEDIFKVINSEYYIISGGYEYNGLELTSINKDEIVNIVNKHLKNDEHIYAISCVFSPINSAQEEKVREIIKSIDKEAVISISSEVGTLSLLERENATILNSSLNEVIKNVVNGFKDALNNAGVNKADIYLCQNDGTLMDVDYALDFPVLTIASGPTNSLRGGVYLSNTKDAIIIDVGGTTSDIGIIHNGFPQETTLESEIGGIQTNFRMPDIVSIAIGGGTIIKEENGIIKVGPESVGYELSKKALVFGGDVTTLSDIANKLGLCDFGDKNYLKDLDLGFAKKVMDIVKAKIEDAIDLVKTSNDKMDLVIVGGGSVVIPTEYDNVSNIKQPDNHDVANAIGASIAKVSGTYEGLISFAKTPRLEAIENSKQKAITNAIKAGALESSIEVVEIEEFPIAYHPEDAVRLRVKVVGDLKTKN